MGVDPSNLQSRQFMSVGELGAYRSQDYPDQTMDQVHEMFSQREQSNSAFKFHMDQIREDMQERGLQFPVHVNTARKEFGNGHHRFHAARTTGMEQLPVTGDIRASTGKNDGWYA